MPSYKVKMKSGNVFTVNAASASLARGIVKSRIPGKKKGIASVVRVKGK
jgi:hypothetical protein